MDGLASNPEDGWRRPAARRGRPSRWFRPALGAQRFEDRTMLSVGLVSVNAAGTASGNSDSMLPVNLNVGALGTAGEAFQEMSSDGRLMVFQSDATNLVAGVYDSNKASDVF